MRWVAAGVLLLSPALWAGTAEARNVCRDAGLKGVTLINCELRTYVKKTAGALVTTYGNNDGHLGKPVACGGVLDRQALTFAHRSLPCGAKVAFKSRRGNWVTATRTDAGPYSDAEYDLSPGLSDALGLETGYVEVRR